MVISCLCFLFFFWGEIPPSTKGTRWIRTSFTANSYTFGDFKWKEKTNSAIILNPPHRIYTFLCNEQEQGEWGRTHLGSSNVYVAAWFSYMFPVERSQADKLPGLRFLSKVLLTCLQFLVPISRAMEQKLLKYVPCNTLKSDSSAPLHCTTEASCSVASSSPGRSLVGVWQREFPSVIHTYEKKRKKKLTVAGSLHGKKEITYSFIPRTTAHWSHLYTFYQHASIFKSTNFLLPCWIRARTRMYWKSWWFKRVHSHPDCAFSCCSTSNDWLSSAPSPHYIKWFWEGHLLWRTGWQSAIWDHCDEILMFNTWK